MGLPRRGRGLIRDFIRSARYRIPLQTARPVFPSAPKMQRGRFTGSTIAIPCACQFARKLVTFEYFGKGIDISPAEKVAGLAAALGEDRGR